ncbi:GAF and ANTAR domain-containing protein [Paractinoplanes hotanensis]|uniref:GAF and ANTAR domain-containing protein n=1 Tax=Paractinoplanes hotanensis TaxID=2906497 RepID=A0ABT0Y5A7_9ACTN|nr:GAF and ANTAR domain-containing protein [Actinoplanes hotanensis]MCM4081005.1 GAF and ANTAR domain-containing protein [Actinoplanes hotanensis]
MTTVSAERLATLFVDVADTLVDEFDVVEFLQMLTRRVAGLFDTGEAGLMLADHRNRLTFMAASDESARLMELFQLQYGDGPCLDAFRTARPVTNVNLAEATQMWPEFAPRATQAGFESVHAFPLRLRKEVIGAMGVFGRSTELDEADAHIVQSLADVAVIGLLQERAIHRGEVLTGQLQGALNSRIVIEQAKGIVAQARGVSPDDGFTLIRDFARRNNRRLSEVAETIVTDLPGLPDLSGR